MANDSKVTVRLPTEIRQSAETLALAEYRSLSDWIRLLVIKATEDQLQTRVVPASPQAKEIARVIRDEQAKGAQITPGAFACRHPVGARIAGTCTMCGKAVK